MTTETEVITRPDGTTGTAGGNAGQNVGTTTGGNTANGDAQAQQKFRTRMFHKM